MDYVESVEPIEESLEGLGPKATVSATFKFKSGLEQVVKFEVPTYTPVYAEPLTSTSIYEIVSAALSFGEAPFLSLPTEDGSQMFVDLSATDYVSVKVDEHE